MLVFGGEVMVPLNSTSEKTKLKILIVEDNHSFRQFFKENLHSRFPSVEIFEAADGEKVLQIVEAESPNLVFMDIQLPGENGLSLTQKIKARYPHIVIVVITTYDIPEYREAAFQYGANRFIPKDSLDWKEIEAVVESLV
jgi:DNA-binding NarL/FixJ family response regulator